MRIVHADTNHPVLLEKLRKAGHENVECYDWSPEELLEKYSDMEGLVIRSRFKVDPPFISKVPNLKFIARVGAGLENIDVVYAAEQDIDLISAPEGNRNAVGEHALGMLLSLLNHLNRADREVKSGQWNRESNRGIELEGKTIGIIGYGHMGKSFAKKLKGFDVEVICYDILPKVQDENARQVSLAEFMERTDVVSLHTPLTDLTINMVDSKFIQAFKKPFWFINTARGKSVVTKDLVEGLRKEKVLGAGLDVLEYEKSSFENLFLEREHIPQTLKDLVELDNVILSPHVAGWTYESHYKLGATIADKIISKFPF